MQSLLEGLEYKSAKQSNMYLDIKDIFKQNLLVCFTLNPTISWILPNTLDAGIIISNNGNREILLVAHSQ